MESAQECRFLSLVDRVDKANCFSWCYWFGRRLYDSAELQGGYGLTVCLGDDYFVMKGSGLVELRLTSFCNRDCCLCDDLWRT